MLVFVVILAEDETKVIPERKVAYAWLVSFVRREVLVWLC